MPNGEVLMDNYFTHSKTVAELVMDMDIPLKIEEGRWIPHDRPPIKKCLYKYLKLRER